MGVCGYVQDAHVQDALARHGHPSLICLRELSMVWFARHLPPAAGTVAEVGLLVQKPQMHINPPPSGALCAKPCSGAGFGIIRGTMAISELNNCKDPYRRAGYIEGPAPLSGAQPAPVLPPRS